MTHDEADTESGQHRERSRRNRVLKKAYLTFHQHASQVPCIVRNVSETGALIELQQFTILPVHFELYVELDGYKVACEKVRQTDRQIAVRFVGEMTNTGTSRAQVVQASDDPQTRLLAREAELKQIIANQRMRQSAKREHEATANPAKDSSKARNNFGKL